MLMLKTILSCLLAILFLLLSLLHLYWLFGGIWGLKKAIPSKSLTAASLRIPRLATLIVASGLLMFSIFYCIVLDLVPIILPNKWQTAVVWGIPSIFLLRAIGDFTYVGFFKRIRNTEFAKADNKIFIPLCLFIGVSGILIAL